MVAVARHTIEIAARLPMALRYRRLMRCSSF
jgi:hypothetical protein